MMLCNAMSCNNIGNRMERNVVRDESGGQEGSPARRRHVWSRRAALDDGAERAASRAQRALRREMRRTDPESRARGEESHAPPGSHAPEYT